MVFDAPLLRKYYQQMDAENHLHQFTKNFNVALLLTAM
jgi:hypothetical protein